jgi:hypothetical protein
MHTINYVFKNYKKSMNKFRLNGKNLFHLCIIMKFEQLFQIHYRKVLLVEPQYLRTYMLFFNSSTGLYAKWQLAHTILPVVYHGF